MPKADEGSSGWLWLVGAMVVLMWVGSCPSDSADTELARTTREAVQMARDAQDADRSAVLWTGRFRMLAVVIGVTAPIVVAYLIWRSSHQSEIDAVEILEVAERLALAERTPLPIPHQAATAAQPVAGVDPDDPGLPGESAD